MSNDAVLEWIQCEDAANLDKKTALIWDYFQEFIAECKEHGNHLIFFIQKASRFH